MERIEVISDRGPYDVVVGGGVISQLGDLCDSNRVPRPSCVVSNTTVAPLYADRLAAGLDIAPAVSLPDGEAHKRWAQVESVCSHLLAAGVHRSDVVAAVGGGVVTDLVGFAAAVYLRGIDWVAVPTTLLAMVDASVGGKTGVNLDQGKNLVGSFWPPRLVVADVETLSTLPSRELRAGMAEVVKSAWIGDHDLLEQLGRPVNAYADFPPHLWQDLVTRSVAVKARVVQADERETGQRKALNLGHTVGHALEAATGYCRFLHGEAVAWGMLAAAGLSERRGLLGSVAAQRLRTAVNNLGPRSSLHDLDPERVLQHLAHDKKRDDLGVAWVLPTDDGVALDQRVDASEVRQVLTEFGRAP